MTSTHDPSDAVLLFHGMKLAASIDGDFGAEEAGVVRSFLATLPGFVDVDFDEMVRRSTALSKEHGGLIESLVALQGLSTPQEKNKCLLLAIEVAFASGDVSPIEEELLGSIQRILGVDLALAQQMREIVRIKYA